MLRAKELGCAPRSWGARQGAGVRAKELGADRFRPLWAKAQELAVPVFVHPLGFSQAERFKDFYLWKNAARLFRISA